MSLYSYMNSYPIKVLVQTLLAILAFWFLVSVIVPGGGSPFSTLLATYLCALISLCFILALLSRAGVISTGLAWLAVALFTLRVIIGVAHYLLFIDSSYFDTNTPVYSYLWDYEWLHYSMGKISRYWVEDGFGSLPPEYLFAIKNTILMPYFALLYYLTGNEHFLNVTIVNSFHAVMVAVLVTGFAVQIATKKGVHAVFTIALLQPFGLFSSMLWRDSVGQFFLIAGAILIIQYKGKLSNIAMPLLGSLLMMSLRNLYFLVGLSTAFMSSMVVAKNRWHTYISSITSLSIALLILNYYLADLIFVFYDLQNQDLAYSKDVISIPKKILTGLTGPFPWTQILDPSTVGREYLLADILQAIFNVTTFFLVLQGLVQNKIKWNEPPYFAALIFVFSIALLGLLSYGHVSYVTVATVLLLPVIPGISLRRFTYVSSWIGSTLFLLGIVWRLL